MIIISDQLLESANICLSLSVIGISAEFLIGASLLRSADNRGVQTNKIPTNKVQIIEVPPYLQVFHSLPVSPLLSLTIILYSSLKYLSYTALSSFWNLFLEMLASTVLFLASLSNCSWMLLSPKFQGFSSLCQFERTLWQPFFRSALLSLVPIVPQLFTHWFSHL